MKKLSIVVMAFFIGISVAFVSCNIDTIIPIKGNGNIISSERAASSFEKVHSAGSAEVCFHASQEYRVVVTTDSNLVEVVTTEIRNNTLNIGTENGNYSFTKLLIDVYCPVLTGVSISGSGSLYGNDTITTLAFDSDVSGSGKIEGTIECEAFFARITGSGKINVSGNGKDSNISISGSGNFNGNDFTINNATVNVSGSGEANVYVIDNLKARISGSGRIKYCGDPSIDSIITGSGKINKM
jgi:hypothetical protein